MTQTLELAKDTRINDAAGLAAARSRPDLGDFLRAFYAHGAAEDIAPYTAAELVGLAEAAMADLSRRAPGQHRISIFNPDHAGAGEAHRGVTVVELLNDDMPFLVDSVMQELTDIGVEVRLLLHPILSVTRNADGQLTGFADPGSPGAIRESLIHIHLIRLADTGQATTIRDRLDKVLADVRATVADWPAMRRVVTELVADYRASPPPLPVEDIAEAIEFLRWLAEDNFTFLGIREYDVSLGGADADRITLKPESGLGLMRDPQVRLLRRGKDFVQVTPEIREFLMRPEPLIVTKANVKSRVHRHAYMDYVGVKRYDEDGRLVGEIRLVGLFTSTAYTRSTRAIPFLRHKVARVLDRAGFSPDSHSGKTLLNVMESYPRDDLFQIEQATLYDYALAILKLDERPRIRVLARRDKFDRFVSVLVYVPRDRFSTEVRLRIGDYLRTVFQGRVSAFYPYFPEGSLTRIHFIIGRDEGETPDPSQTELEAAVAAIVRNWTDSFQEAARARFPAGRAQAVVSRWAGAFPPAYRDSYDAADALADVAAIERLTGGRTTTIAFRDLPGGDIGMKLFHRGGAVPLSARVPVLEAMGFEVIEEKTFAIDSAGEAVVLHDMHLAARSGAALDLGRLGGPLQALFMAVWLDEAESDRLNALALTAGLAWREIAMLRALSRYLQQARIRYDQGYIAETLNRHPAIAASITRLFAARFDPKTPGDRALEEARIAQEIEAALEAVSSIDDDRILRRFINLVVAAQRTTFYQLARDGRPHPVIAFKFDPRRVSDLPEPRPFAEIWVYAPRVEGVHLRFGPVARGGLRWSDRPQDFRTEVLGLVKAQQVKNAVIVPVGAKGGFFPKRLPRGGNRDAVFQEGTEAYKIFVQTMLDLTDNLDGDRVIPPADTVRHDGDDPYLVVAADKGTATFSDTANGLSDAHGFWLSDAFASGGSAGYDHKKMGITARGAWEAVKRHFREMDVDIQKTPFTVAGVGDMSGDVFGNGMLLSPAIRLVAAFDHRDIFIDPNPDPAASLAERQRMFALPRSSWADYDASLISTGGGIFSRQAKSITLSPEAQAAIGLAKARATPQEVMNAILKAPVDLLWFGGIGTYVRAEDESDAEVGDRANDTIRVTAGEIRAKVVGEGANLGMTQKARIAYGLAGGRCNSDAVDNSAGVNSSDVEVNIKIAFGRPVRDGRLKIPARNALLAAMTPEVARLVLANNYRQSLCVSVATGLGLSELGYQRRLMQWLEGRGKLDRAVETLPDDMALARREAEGRPLTRSEIGVLMAYAKIVLFDDLVESDVPDLPMLEKSLISYFPAEMQEPYADDIRTHRLRREIISTVLANAMINRGGPTFPIRLADQAGASMADVARAYLVAVDAFGLDGLEASLDGLDNRIPGALQLDLYSAFSEHLVSCVLWLLRNRPPRGDLNDLARRLGEGVSRYRAWRAERPLEAAAKARLDALLAAGVPAETATRMAGLAGERAALDVILVAEAAGATMAVAADTVTRVSEVFRLDAIDTAAASLETTDYYDGLALDRARRMLADARVRIATAAAAGRGGLDGWMEPRRADTERALGTLRGLLEGEPSVARFSVAAGLLSDLSATAAK